VWVARVPLFPFRERRPFSVQSLLRPFPWDSIRSLRCPALAPPPFPLSPTPSPPSDELASPPPVVDYLPPFCLCSLVPPPQEDRFSNALYGRFFFRTSFLPYAKSPSPPLVGRPVFSSPEPAFTGGFVRSVLPSVILFFRCASLAQPSPLRFFLVFRFIRARSAPFFLFLCWAYNCSGVISGRPGAYFCRPFRLFL